MAYGSSSFGSETYGGSSNITPARQVTFFLQSALIKNNLIKTFALDVKLILRNSISFSLDARLILRNLSTFNLDTALQKTFLNTFTINAYLKLFGTEKTFTIDSRLVHRRELNFTLDGARRKTLSNTFTLGARVYVTKHWLDSWKFRKNIIIDGSTDGTLTNFQIKYTIHKGGGTDTLTDIYCNNNIKNDFSDLRFTTQNGKRLLDYWIETSVSGDNATVWVEVDYIPVAPNQTNIYIYYGNSGAINNSSLDNTMIFGDIFDGTLAKWTYPGNVNIVDIVTGKLHVGVAGVIAPPAFGGAHSITTFSKLLNGNFAVEFKGVSATRKFRENDMWFGLSNKNLLLTQSFITPNALYFDSSDFITGFVADNQTALTPINLTDSHNFIIEWFGTYSNLYIDDVFAATDTVSDADIRIIFKLEKDPTQNFTDDSYLDTVFVRKTAVFPPISTIGTQESLNVGRGMSRTHRVGLRIING